MSIENPQKLIADMLEEISGQWQTREGSFAYDMVAAVALELWKERMTLESMLGQFYIDENSGIFIDRQAAMLGITRKSAVHAIGTVTFSGQQGKEIPDGQIVQTADGVRFFAVEGGVIGAENVLMAEAHAETAGAAGNVHAGTVTLVPPIPGVTATISDAEMGADAESDKELVTRFYERLQKPATSGNIWQYHAWAKSCDGVAAASVVGLARGAGTVDVYLTGPDGSAVSAACISACSGLIERERPVGADVTVSNAEIVPVSLSAQIEQAGDRPAAYFESAWRENVQQLIEEARAAFDTGRFSDGSPAEIYTLAYQRILAALYAIPGVVDFSEMLVNDDTVDIVLEANQVPTISGVEVTIDVV